MRARGDGARRRQPAARARGRRLGHRVRRLGAAREGRPVAPAGHHRHACSGDDPAARPRDAERHRSPTGRRRPGRTSTPTCSPPRRRSAAAASSPPPPGATPTPRSATGAPNLVRTRPLATSGLASRRPTGSRCPGETWASRETRGSTGWASTSSARRAADATRWPTVGPARSCRCCPAPGSAAGQRARTRLALVVPIKAPVRRGPAGRLLNINRWQTAALLGRSARPVAAAEQPRPAAVHLGDRPRRPRRGPVGGTRQPSRSTQARAAAVTRAARSPPRRPRRASRPATRRQTPRRRRAASPTRAGTATATSRQRRSRPRTPCPPGSGSPSSAGRRLIAPWPPFPTRDLDVASALGAGRAAGSTRSTGRPSD